jgi:cytochrome c peroxidase
MHDGRFKTLEEVVDHYDHGVTETETLDPSISKHGGPMRLSAEEKRALVAFLNTLTDEKFVEHAKQLQNKK